MHGVEQGFFAVKAAGTTALCGCRLHYIGTTIEILDSTVKAWQYSVGLAMEFLDNTIALISRTPSVLDTLLRDLDEVWTLRNEGHDTWNAFDVIGHMIHAERADFLPRARIILEHGETQPFPPFDRFAQTKESQGKSLAQLLDEFCRLRYEGVDELRALNLQPEDLERRGRHPALGTVTLGNLLACWAAHDLTHLHQISRIMAHQYRGMVGSWAEFLGVLQCQGHSAP